VTSIKKKKHFIERARTVIVVAMLCMIVGGVAGYSLYPRGFIILPFLCTACSLGWFVTGTLQEAAWADL
jgi:hypothetical protein